MEYTDISVDSYSPLSVIFFWEPAIELYHYKYSVAKITCTMLWTCLETRSCLFCDHAKHATSVEGSILFAYVLDSPLI